MVLYNIVKVDLYEKKDVILVYKQNFDNIYNNMFIIFLLH